MFKQAKNVKTISSCVLLLLFLLLPLSVGSQPALAQEALESLNSTESGVFARGELAYVSDEKDLGSESYELVKRDSGEIVLISEGVVTPPIPIPFVNPKIKFDQEIKVGEDLFPRTIKLNYDGPLGIGSDKIRATVQNGQIDADLGGERKEAELESIDSFFQGTGGAQALTALILSKKDGLEEIVEIRTGGTGPQSGDEDRLKAYLELKRKDTRELEFEGSGTREVNRYVLNDPGSDVDKVILADGGTFIAYLRLGGENPFYVYRSDLLGEDYEFN
ncbi:hypothetical protein KGY71_06180 [Candidatus Bipolaricaulota bacterium]|nr:hypothetical protein [Candidatus Bipolaricaulota bacterium]